MQKFQISVFLRQIGVNFNSKIAFDIMIGKPGVTKTLFYETWMELSKAESNFKTGTTELLSNDRVLRAINPSKPSYDKTMSVAFENAVRAMMDNPNTIDMWNVLTRFIIKRNSLILSQKNIHICCMRQRQRQRYKEVRNHRKNHEDAFLTAWDALMLINGKRIKTVAKDRRTLEKRVITKVEKTSHDKRVTANLEARSSTMGDIDAFERRLETAVFPDDPDLNATVGQAVKKCLEGDPTKGVPSTTYIDESYLKRVLVKAQRAM